MFPGEPAAAFEDRALRARTFAVILVILDSALLALFFALYLTVFSEPAYVPFASGSISTLVPGGPHESTQQGPWEKNYFEGKGRLTIGIRRVSDFSLGDVVRVTRGGAMRELDPERRASLEALIRRTQSRGESRGDTLSGDFDLGELVMHLRRDTTRADSIAIPYDLYRMEHGRTIIQLMSSNTPNLRMTQEIPTFDGAIFCLGSVGRGERWYRYLVLSTDKVVDISMHSPNSSHIVYKMVADKALLNLRIDGVTTNHILEQAIYELDGRISPRWAQGNTFWLAFFIALPTGIMLLLALVFTLRARLARPDRPDFKVSLS